MSETDAPQQSDGHTDDSKAKGGKSASRHFWTVVFVACIGLFVWNEMRSAKRDRTKAISPDEILESGSASGFNVLLITLDTTRQDYLACYGYPRAITPTIDSLTENGVRFDDAVSSAPMTLPSHSVIMTGQYPPSIGVRDNGNYRLIDRHVTLAEKLKSAGYKTAAFVSAFVLDERFGLSQGFDDYDFAIDDEGRESSDSILSERDAAAVTSAALKWLKKRDSNAPFFAWVHYFDPHQPYLSPLTDTEGFVDRGYDAEIAFADRNIKRLLEHLDQSGIRDNTLIVFVTDHGEGLMEHEEQLHGIFLYESTMRVGMIYSNPQLFDGAYRVDDRVVTTADIAPTVVDLVGLSPLGKTDGLSLASTPIGADRAVYMETLMPLTHACTPLHALRTHTGKFILAPEKEFYDIANDRQELNNIYDTSEAAKKLESTLVAMLADWEKDGSSLAGAQDMSDDAKRKLESLGYVTGGASMDGSPLRDPKKQIGVINQMSEVKRLQALGHTTEALRLAEEVRVQAEGWYAPIINIAQMHQQLGDNTKAASILEQYIDEHPESAPTSAHLHLAELYFVLNRDHDCLRKLDDVDQRDPNIGKAAMIRGDVYVRQNKYAQAEQQYQRANQVDPLRIGPFYRERIAKLRRMMNESP